MKRSTAVLALIPVLAMSCAGCAHRVRGPRLAPDAPAAAGVYRGWAIDGESRGPRFRLLLQIVPPAGIHAEILPPVGGPEWILDADHERASVTLVSEGVAYVGDVEGPEAERLLGVPVTIGALVAALWSGAEPGSGVTIDRHPTGRPGLPERFELRARDRGFLLERVGIRPGGQGVATGTPPAGVGVRPLDELADAGLLDRVGTKGRDTP